MTLPGERAILLQELGEWSEARTLYQSIRPIYEAEATPLSRASLWINLANLLQALGEWPEARLLYEQVFKDTPTLPSPGATHCS